MNYRTKKKQAWVKSYNEFHFRKGSYRFARCSWKAICNYVSNMEHPQVKVRYVSLRKARKLDARKDLRRRKGNGDITTRPKAG